MRHLRGFTYPQNIVEILWPVKALGIILTNPCLALSFPKEAQYGYRYVHV